LAGYDNNDYTLISVLIAECENEFISLYILSVAWVVIAECENECIPLSVLSVAWVVIAECENECIPLSVLSVARVDIPPVAEYRYFMRFLLAGHPLPPRPVLAWPKIGAFASSRANFF